MGNLIKSNIPENRHYKNNTFRKNVQELNKLNCKYLKMNKLQLNGGLL